jgi:hypothetical protein
MEFTRAGKAQTQTDEFKASLLESWMKAKDAPKEVRLAWSEGKIAWVVTGHEFSEEPKEVELRELAAFVRLHRTEIHGLFRMVLGSIVAVNRAELDWLTSQSFAEPN